MTQAKLSKVVKKTYIQREMLKGLISWKEYVKTDVLHNDLHITTDVPVKNIYVNGKLI